MTMDALFAGQGATALEKYRARRSDAAPHEIVGAVETDRMFRVPAVRLADAQTAHNANVWMYLVSRRPGGDELCPRPVHHIGEGGRRIRSVEPGCHGASQVVEDV